jgi:hypothetical protein
VSGDLLAAGAGDGLDQGVAVVIDAQDRVVDFDGDDLAGVAQPDLDALADDWVPRGRTLCAGPGRGAYGY